ncbi:MAG: LacI family DNA-binding transcriptional regulator, partial [Chloroflexota bacterium]
IDVAKRAGVSQSTVSRVFSANSANVSEKATQRVLEAATALGYQPNIIARMMSTRQTNIIGLVMATITSPFYPYVLEKFLEELQALGKQVLLFTASKNQTVDDILPLVFQYQVDALIITSATLSSDMASRAAESGTPVILFNRVVSNNTVNSVSADNLAGGRLAADVLLDSGHQRLAFMAGVENTSTSRDRERGFVSRLHERNYHDLIRVQGNYTYESAYNVTQTLLKQDKRPDALFCANDIMAIGAIDAIREAGLCVPQDISVLGFDDIPMASWGSYQLTTISQNVDAMIQATIELMQAKITNPLTPSRTVHIAGELIMRSSVKNLHIPQE